MQPIINWVALRNLTQPARMHPPLKDAAREKEFASFYNKMASMEKGYTPNQVNALPLLPDDTLLDMGCGPGRLSVPLARHVKSVTALDVSEEVLKYCRKNAKAAGLNNLTTKNLDFDKIVADKDIEKHDVVVCSRSVGLWNLEKLTTFAKRLTAVISFANAPTIPQLLLNIFDGTSAESEQNPPFANYGKDRRINYNAIFNIVYDLGYEPNIRIVSDGFKKDFATKEEAYEDIRSLGKVDDDKMDTYRSHLDNYLAKNDSGGFTFFLETRTCVIWWENKPQRFW